MQTDAPPTIHTGPIRSEVGGRTDLHHMYVEAGSYVIPADIVSGLGEGNTERGFVVLEKLFTRGPYKRMVGAGHAGSPVEILAAGGEYVVSPDQIVSIGAGDLDKGHAILDKFVRDQRKLLVKTLTNLPGPVKS